MKTFLNISEFMFEAVEALIICIVCIELIIALRRAK